MIQGFTFSGTKLRIAGIEKGPVSCIGLIFYDTFHIHPRT